MGDGALLQLWRLLQNALLVVKHRLALLAAGSLSARAQARAISLDEYVRYVMSIQTNHSMYSLSEDAKSLGKKRDDEMHVMTLTPAAASVDPWNNVTDTIHQQTGIIENARVVS